MAVDSKQDRVPKEIADLLVQLFKLRVVGPETLDEVASNLSRKGYSRAQIVDFFYRMISDFEEELAEEQVDMIGDLNQAISGFQCALGNIKRFDGDPADPLALATAVREQMKGWKPPA